MVCMFVYIELKFFSCIKHSEGIFFTWDTMDSHPCLQWFLKCSMPKYCSESNTAMLNVLTKHVCFFE